MLAVSLAALVPGTALGDYHHWSLHGASSSMNLKMIRHMLGVERANLSLRIPFCP
jgi:hypothetical protein